MLFMGAAIDFDCARRCSHGPVGRLASVKTGHKVNRPQAGGYIMQA
jgi:hypothetical protein